MRRTTKLSLIILLISFFAFSCGSSSDNNDTGVPVTEFVYSLENQFPNLSFDRPVGIENAGDGTNRLFVVEQKGVVKVIDNTPVVNSNTRVNFVSEAGVFLDIQDRVMFDGIESGLLGLAFHPNYENNGYIYVNYVASIPLRTVISRFTVSGTDPNKIDPDSELVILEQSQPHVFHNGGQLVFGPSDGLLYIALGDGGPMGGVSIESQNLTNLLGKVSRIDVNNPQGNMNYGIPPANPFVNNQLGVREEIFAYGFRNPWRLSIDPVTGLIWTGDVGQDSIEEIDIVVSGENYGWPIMEGTMCFSPSMGCDTTGLVLPIWEYGRGQGKTIIGGYVYRGQLLTNLVGKYIYGDFISGRIWALVYDGVSVNSNEELLKISSGDSFLISSFGLDEQGELYISGLDGKVYVIVEEEIVAP